MFKKGQKVIINKTNYIIVSKSSHRVNKNTGKLEQHYIVQKENSNSTMLAGISEIRRYECQ